MIDEIFHLSICAGRRKVCGFGYMYNQESWNTFIAELRAYVEEHKLFPQKHSRLSHKIKYTRKKINEGTLEDWTREMFEEIAEMRDMEEHTGGRKRLKG